jgi:aarF domain-containing kinase
VVTAAAVNAAQKALWSPPVRRAVRFWWVAGPIVAHYRFAQWWLDSLPGNNKDRRDRVYAGLHRRYCDPTFRLMLELRGLFVKVGQVLSSRPDFVPDEYVRLFASLQDSIPPWTIDCVKDVVDRSLQAEHGVTYEQVFESMDPIALGSASIGQVHRAVLRRKEDATNNSGAAVGREVAVKVMHPGAKDQFRHDFLIYRWLCRLALPTWMGLLNELERRMMTEFDYKNEAESLRLVRHNLVVERSSPYRNRVSVPEPVRHLCTQDVLVMELLRGRKLVDDVKQRLDQALGIEGAAEDLIRRRQAQLTMVINNKRERESDGDDSLRDLVDGAGFLAKLRMLSVRKRCQRYVDLLVDVHGHQIFVNGAFNGDPHPGNVLVLEDGRLGLIDFGQTRRLTDQERWGFARVVLALVEGSDDEEVAETLRRAGFASQDDNDATTLARYATLFFDSDHESRNLGFATPQLYYASLMRSNPLTVIPDAASE